MTVQLTLPLQFSDEVRLDNFIAGDNTQILHTLSHLMPLGGWDYYYLWGAPGSGKSHLLQACCAHLMAQGISVSYFNLTDVLVTQGAILQGLEQFEVVALDDVHVVAGNSDWEEALFTCFNALQDAGRLLLVSATAPPAKTALALPDLVSRLQSGVIYALKPLQDDDKIVVLQQRARAHGLDLSAEVGQYLLNHHQRDMPKLLGALELLDKASLENKRRLTIPFVKEVLRLTVGQN